MSTLPPIPSPITVAIRGYELLSRYALVGWDISELLEGEQVAIYEAPYELRKMHAVYTRGPAGAPSQDVALTTHHFLNLTAGVPDATWIGGDYDQVEGAFANMWAAIKPLFTADVVLHELRWYADGPAFKPFGDDPSPMVRATTLNTPGTASAAYMLPPQTSISVTEVTTARYSTVAREGRPSQLRHRWGRFYLPAPSTAALSAVTAQGGRLAPAAQTTIADAVEDFYNACRTGSNLVPVMYSPTTGSSWSVDEVHVDDIFDVVRSRRFETPLSRAVRTLV